MENNAVRRLLDGQGKLSSLPKKKELRKKALRWLVGMFSSAQFYSEKEVNDLLVSCCSTGDFSLLRRELCDSGFLSRNNNGEKYWRNDFLCGKIESDDIRLRDLYESDIKTLLTIHDSLEYYTDITGEPFGKEEAFRLLEKRDLPPNGCQEFLKTKIILDSDSQVLGYLAIYEGYPTQKVLWIGSLFLHKKYHHQGVGKKVRKMLEESAGECGFLSLGLGVYVQNQAGLQFWVNQGFCKIESVCMNQNQKTILRLSKNINNYSL